MIELLRKKKRDILLLAVLLIMGAFFYVLICFKGDGAAVEVLVDGKVIAGYSLSEKGTYEIEGTNGSNILIIENGSAYMFDADCPDKLCVHMGKISKAGEAIICLPNKIVVRVAMNTTFSENGLDATDAVAR